MKTLIFSILTLSESIRQSCIIKTKHKIMKAKDGLLRKRIFGVSVLFHIALIVAAMTTYYTIKKVNKTEESDQMSYIEIRFTNSNKDAGMGSTKKSVEKKVEQVTARAIEEKVIKIEPLEESENETVTESKNVKNSKTTSDIEKNKNSETDGEGDEGTLLKGVGLGSLDFDGDGVFGRKVIYHAPIKKIAETDGKISINIAINRKGDVISAAINKEYSTITDKELLVKAMEMIIRYKFETDYNAPKFQYGKFTFIFDLKNS